MNYQAIVFDLDGTLIDSSALMVNAFKHALTPFNLDVSAQEVEAMRSLSSAELFRDRLSEEHAAEAVARLWSYSQRAVPDTLLIEGIDVLLQQVADKNITMGVWTGRDRASALAILKHHQIDNFFHALVGGSEVAKNKPHPEGLLLLAQKLDIAPDLLLHIGDHDHDLLGAQQAGAASALVEWCPPDVLNQNAHLAHYTFKSVHAFSSWIATIN